jgi:hypothetical protein
VQPFLIARRNDAILQADAGASRHWHTIGGDRIVCGLAEGEVDGQPHAPTRGGHPETGTAVPAPGPAACSLWFVRNVKPLRLQDFTTAADWHGGCSRSFRLRGV